jgi:hypothetical protein
MSDTVGFVSELPHDLVEAFRYGSHAAARAGRERGADAPRSLGSAGLQRPRYGAGASIIPNRPCDSSSGPAVK